MEVINKNSKVIKKHQKYARFSPFIRITDGKYIGIPLSTVELADLRVGNYLHFVDMGKTVCFFSNNDPSGFKLIYNSKRDNALRIGSAAFVDWFRAKFKIKTKGSVAFYVNPTASEHKGFPLFEILTDTPRPEHTTKSKL